MFLGEIYRAFWNRRLGVAIGLAIASLGYGLYEYQLGPADISNLHPFHYNAYDAIIWAQGNIIALLVPLIAVLPYADSLVEDRVSGFLRFVLIRVSYRYYLFAKFAVCWLSGGVATALPMLCFFVFVLLLYPRGLLPLSLARVVPTGPLSGLYATAPDLYIFFLVALAFVFGGVYAILGLAVATLTDNRYVVVVIPFLLYHVANFVLALLGWEVWTPPVTFAPHIMNQVSWLEVLGELGAVLLGSSILFIWSTAQMRVRI